MLLVEKVNEKSFLLLFFKFKEVESKFATVNQFTQIRFSKED